MQNSANGPRPMGPELVEMARDALSNHTELVLIGEKIRNINGAYGLALDASDQSNAKHMLKLHQEFVDYLMTEKPIRLPWTLIREDVNDSSNFVMVDIGDSVIKRAEVNVTKLISQKFRFVPTDMDSETIQYALFMMDNMFLYFAYRNASVANKIERAQETKNLWKSNGTLRHFWIRSIVLENNDANGVNMTIDVNSLKAFKTAIDGLLNLFHLVATLGGRP